MEENKKIEEKEKDFIDIADEMVDKLKQTCPVAGYFVEFMVVVSVIYGIYVTGRFIWNSVSSMF